MELELSADFIEKIQHHGAAAYPEEGAGFLLGRDHPSGGRIGREVLAILELPNRREDGARHNRYLIGPKDYLQAEDEADHLGLTLVGVFHSHPDHPDRPSDFDRDWAQPWFSYVITSIQNGRAVSSRSWRLLEDRSGFEEENIRITSVNAVLSDGERKSSPQPLSRRQRGEERLPGGEALGMREKLISQD